jgi:hypothetical protein
VCVCACVRLYRDVCMERCIFSSCAIGVFVAVEIVVVLYSFRVGVKGGVCGASFLCGSVRVCRVFV